MNTIAFLDANIFPHVVLTDVLLTFADFHLYDPIFSEDVLQEARRAMIDALGKDPAAVDRYFNAVRSIQPYYLVSSEPTLADEILLPDPDDRHVLAAAYNAQADVVVTFNLKDFPSDPLGKLSLTACHPDQFLTQVATEHPTRAAQAMTQLVASKERPVRTIDEELNRLTRTGMPHFVDAMRCILAPR